MSEKFKSESRPAAPRPPVAGKGRCLSSAWRQPALAASVVLLFFLLPFRSFAQTGQAIDPGEVLTLSRAIEIALKSQPAIVGARYTMRANEARVGEAQSNYFPQITGAASYPKFSSVATAVLASPTIGGAPPIVGAGPSTAQSPTLSPTSTGAFNQYTGSMGLTQTVYDFGKTSTQVRINKLNTDAARFDLANIQQTVAFNVKQAYYNVLQAQRNAEVSRQSVKQLQQHLDQARGFFEAGTKSKFDVTKADVDLSNGQVSLIAAENQVRLALLRSTMRSAFRMPPITGSKTAFSMSGSSCPSKRLWNRPMPRDPIFLRR